MILRAGPAFLGAYLVLATLVVTLKAFVTSLLDVAMGPQNVAWSLATDPFTELGLDLLFTTISVALYVAAVDRLFAAAAGLEWTGRPAVTRSSPSRAPGHRRTSSSSRSVDRRIRKVSVSAASAGTMNRAPTSNGTRS